MSDADNIEFIPPRTAGDLAAMIIEYLHDQGRDEVEKTNHEDHGDTEVLEFNFSNGRTFRIEIKEVETK